MTSNGGSAGSGSTPTGSGSPAAGLPQSLRPARRRLRDALVVLALALLATAGLTTAFVDAGPARADRAVLGELVGTRSEGLTAAAVTVTNAGSTASMGLLAVLVGLVLVRRRRGVDALFVVGTMAGASILFSGLKRLLDRPRPPVPDQLVSAANESLPSGHATMSVAVLGSLVALGWRGWRVAVRAIAVAAATLWVVAVGVTRLYLGVHWFSDVLAGWLVGAVWLALCTTAWSRWRVPVAGCANGTLDR